MEATPSAIAPKRDPDRTCRPVKGVIADMRRINLFSDASDVLPAELPAIRDLSRRIVSLKRRPHQKPAVLE